MPKKNALKQKPTISRKKKSADVDDDRYNENLALAVEIIAQGGESEEEANEGNSQQWQTTTGGVV